MKILHPTDFSECADLAQEQAIRLARAMGGEIILLHVALDTPLYGEGLMAMREVKAVYEAQRKWATEALEARAAAIRPQGPPTRWRLERGVPHEEIVSVATADGADLIVMGTRGLSGLERFFLGSVADRVIRTAPCPVLTVRGPKGEGDR